MSRPKKLSLNTKRLTIELDREVYSYLRVQSALRDAPISLMVEEIIRAAVPQAELEFRGLPVPTSPLQAALSLNVERFPLGWDGADLNQRLYRLGRTQKELALSVNIPQQTLNRWCRNGKIPPREVARIQKRLAEWAAEATREGLQSPT